MNITPLSLALAALGVTGTAIAVGYSRLMTQPAGQWAMPVGEPVPASSAGRQQRSAVVAVVESAEVGARGGTTAQASPDEVAKWLADAGSDDAMIRSVAIWHLGSARKEIALPVLRRIMITAGAEERDIALEALGMLAREQGDADGAIRNVLRETIYHGADDDVLFTARSTLDHVENELAPSPPP